MLLALCTTLSSFVFVRLTILLCGRSYPDRNILLALSLLVGRRLGANSGVLAVGELGVGLEGFLRLVCDRC